MPDGYSTDMGTAAFFRLKDDFHAAEDAAGRNASCFNVVHYGECKNASHGRCRRCAKAERDRGGD